MKKNYQRNNQNVAIISGKSLRIYFTSIMTLFLFSLHVSAQTTVFIDDFNRNQNPFGETGGTPTITWNLMTTGTGTGNYTRTEQISGSDYRLALFNGSTSTSSATTRGRTYLYGSLSTFNSPFNPKLSENIHEIIWTLNIRTGRHTSATAGDEGFNATDGHFGYAVILAASSSDFLAANGYAVTLRRVPTLGNAVRLEKFENGLTSNTNLTTIIGPSDVLTTQSNYFSVKVVYTPSTNTWKLYARVDGTTPADPASGALTQVGTDVVNSDLTGTTMTSCGFFVNHQSLTWNNGNNKGNFDNFKVVVDNSTTLTNQSSIERTVLVANGKIVMLTNGDVFNSVGVKVASATNVQYRKEISLSSGVYFVRTSYSTTKVLIP